MKQQQNTGFQTYILNCFIVIYLKVKKKKLTSELKKMSININQQKLGRNIN